jgi:hypothetical protein
MALTDKNLITERSHLGGVQRLYRAGRYGLSLVNGAMLHSYPFAWEAAVMDYGTPDGTASHLTYATPLTDDVEVFHSDEEADEFIAKAFEWFAAQTVEAA